MPEAVTAAQAAAIDRRAREECGIDVLQLMEVAGLRSAELAREVFGDTKDITVLAGPGGNGGDALVCAKWLQLWGFHPHVVLSHAPSTLKPVTQRQLRIWEALGGGVLEEPPVRSGGVVDGLLGISASGSPRGRVADLIAWANGCGSPIVALDVPSGLDPTIGVPGSPCIRARRTVVLGVMKAGLLAASAKPYVGDLILVDIGLPRESTPS